MQRLALAAFCDLNSNNIGSQTTTIWDKVFKNRSSKICGRQPLKKFEVILWSAWANNVISNFLKAVFHKFNLFYSLSTIFNLPLELFQLVYIE